MCYDKSWFVSESSKAKADERKPEMKDKRAETVDALLRDSREQAQKAAAPKEPAPAK
jgi:hypothetical protein